MAAGILIGVALVVVLVGAAFYGYLVWKRKSAKC